MEGKGTGKCYLCQVQNYQVWFEEEQSWIAASDPSWTGLPAFPITAAKVATFIHNKSTCEKVCLVSALPPCHLIERSHAAQVRKQVQDSLMLLAGQVPHHTGHQCIGESQAQS